MVVYYHLKIVCDKWKMHTGNLTANTKVTTKN